MKKTILGKIILISTVASMTLYGAQMETSTAIGVLNDAVKELVKDNKELRSKILHLENETKLLKDEMLRVKYPNIDNGEKLNTRLDSVENIGIGTKNKTVIHSERIPPQEILKVNEQVNLLDKEEEFYVTLENVNVRAEPNLNSKIIGVYSGGSKIVAYSGLIDGKWRFIKDNNGYISTTVISPAIDKKYIVKKESDLRSSPNYSTRDNIVDVLQVGEILDIVAINYDNKYAMTKDGKFVFLLNIEEVKND